MAKPMTAVQFRAQMTKWHVKVKYREGWETNGRNVGSTRPWGPSNGVTIHHTGSDTNTSAYIAGLFMERGMRYPDLPGPLCQGSTGPDGVTTVGALGRANHAGAGTQSAFDKIISENYPGYDSEIRPGGSSGVDGNTHFYGDEVRFSGAHPMTAEQYEGAVRWTAAILDFYGWSALSAFGHREWTSAKPDPGHTPMDKFRRDVRALLQAGPGGAVTVPPEHEPLPTLDWTAVDSYPDAEHPDRNTVGVHITELGKHVVAHLTAMGITPPYLDGPGPTWTDTDRRAVQMFQVARGYHALANGQADLTQLKPGGACDGYPGLLTLSDLQQAPGTFQKWEQAPLEPPKLPTATQMNVSYVSLNRADYNAEYGAKTRAQRHDEVADYIHAFEDISANPNNILFVDLQECAIDSCSPMDVRLAEFKRIGEGGKGRESWFRRGVGMTILKARLMNVSHMLRADTKPFLVYAWKKDGFVGVRANFHSENEKTSLWSGLLQKYQLDDVRKAMFAMADEIADREGLPRSVVRANCCMTGDSNDKRAASWIKGWGLDEISTDAEEGATGEEYHSTNDWGVTTLGRRIDVDGVGKGRARRAIWRRPRRGKVSDHNGRYCRYIVTK